MADGTFWTAEQLEQLCPDERAQVVRDGFVTDLSEVPEPLLERVRANVRAHISETESAHIADR